MNEVIETNQELQETTLHTEKTDAVLTASHAGVVEQEGTATGAGCAGRSCTDPETTPGKEPGNIPSNNCPPRRIVKKKRYLQGHTNKKNSGGNATTGKRSGQHVPRGTIEVAEILKHEGYTIGKVLDPESPFDLMGWSHAGSILARVARPRESVANARNVWEQYEDVIRQMEPYYRSEADNIQLLVISREHGLLRYRVYNWGIGNVITMQKIMKIPRKSQSDNQTPAPKPSDQRARTSPCPYAATGLAGAPESTPVPAAILW